jgi:hypothetical protein
LEPFRKKNNRLLPVKRKCFSSWQFTADAWLHK